MAEPRAKAPQRASGKSTKKKEPRKIEYLEGEEAFENFARMTKHLLSVPKSVIDEREKASKKK
jgi:hypothetical protein